MHLSESGFLMGDLLDLIQRWFEQTLDLPRFNDDFDQAMQACMAQDPLVWVKLQQGLSSLKQHMSISHEYVVAYQAQLKRYPQQDLKSSAVMISVDASLKHVEMKHEEAEMLVRFILCQVLVWCEHLVQHRGGDRYGLFGQPSLPPLPLKTLIAELGALVKMNDQNRYPQISLLLLSQVIGYPSGAKKLELLSREVVEDQFKHFMSLCAENDFPVTQANITLMQALQTHVAKYELHYFGWCELLSKARRNNMNVFSRLDALGFDFLLPLFGDMQGFIPYFGVQFLLRKGGVDVDVLEQIEAVTSDAESTQQKSRWDFLETDLAFVLDNWIDGSTQFIHDCFEKVPEKTMLIYDNWYTQLISVVNGQAIDFCVGSYVSGMPRVAMAAELTVKCTDVLYLIRYLSASPNAHMLEPMKQSDVLSLIDPCCETIQDFDRWEETVDKWMMLNQADQDTLQAYKALVATCVQAIGVEEGVAIRANSR